MRTRALPLAVLSASALLALTACTAGTTADETEPTDAATTGDPGVVVALDDFAALNALSLGVVPDVVFDAFEYETSAAIFADQGIEPIPYGSELDLERVIGAEPDLIIGVSLPTTVAQQDALEQIATTVIFDYTADWRTQLEQTAEALGRADQAEEIADGIDADLAALDEEIEGEPVVSVLAGGETVFSVPEQSGLGTVLSAAGLTRPEAQAVEVEATAPFIDVSLETLADHDGDAIMLMSGAAYDPATLTGSPLWSSLSAVQGDAVHEVTAELWFAASPFAIDWVIDDLRATLVEGGEAATPADAVDRFRAFLEG